MNPSPLLRARVICFAFMPCLLLPCLTGASAWAQDKTAAAAASAPAKTRPTAPALFSLDLKATPLRQALVSLFTNANAQYSLDEDVPDTSVTLTIRNQPLENALRLILQQGSGAQKVTWTVESSVYRIKTLPAAPAVTEPVRTRGIRVTNVRATDIVSRLQTAFPTSLILPGADTSSLVVRGLEQQNQDVDELAHLLDSGASTVVLKAEVILVTDSGSAKAAGTKPQKTPAGGGSRSTLLSTVLRTLTGQEATGDDKLMGTPAQSAKMQIIATPARLGGGAFQVDTRWDVSLPLPTGKTTPNGAKGAGIVRLEKRLTTTTRLRSGETVLVGGVVLSQYGLKGEVLFFITLSEVRDGPPAQGVPGP